MPKRIDKVALQHTLMRHLRVVGPTAAAPLLQLLQVSQPALSRLLHALQADTVVMGKSRATLYAARRRVEGIAGAVPVYEIANNGTSRTLCRLHPIEPKGFYVEALCADVDAAYYDDLPFFLNDQRPSGFLGRFVPRLHPELLMPTDVRLWTGDQCLRYLTLYGSNQAGNLIVGDMAFTRYLDTLATPIDAVVTADRGVVYPARAANVLTAMPVGSSAAGEQPKFLATVMPEHTAALVKFSPPTDNPLAQRIADLLICEHLAHSTLQQYGVAAARSEIVLAQQRIFLQVTRFDRLTQGRQGCLSLAPLNLHYLGGEDRWGAIAAGLYAQRRIDAQTEQKIAWLDVFGELIANNDRHPGNMALLTRGTRLLDLAPVYDMLPMFYAPRGTELPDVQFVPPVPRPSWAAHWASACAAAADFWQRVAVHDNVSLGFRHIAQANAAAVQKVSSLAEKLPS